MVGLCTIAFLATAVAHASDRVSVYAKVDRVVLAPSAEAPDTIQIFGVFSVAQPNNPNDYRPAARGYLYYTAGTNRDAARREWADLKSIAGSGQVVAFGSRWEGTPRVRDTGETPSTPDEYAVNTGVTKINGRTDYAPVRALIDFKR
jgi:hypothetical protein